jgi:hypothetical protein
MRGCQDALAACALFPNRLPPFGQGQGQDADNAYRGESYGYHGQQPKYIGQNQQRCFRPKRIHGLLPN